MSDKISPIAVIKEGCAIFWARKWSFLGLMLLLLAVTFGLQFAQVFVLGSTVDPANAGGAELGTSIAFGLVSFVAVILLSLFTATTFNHLAITHMRGAGRILPEKLLGAMWRVFVRGLLLFVVIFVGELVVFTPILIFVIFFSPSGDGGLSWQLGLGMVLYFPVAFFLLGGLMLRLSVMIPGAAVGHKVSLREAWAMTKGHTWRMIGWYVLLAVSVAILVGIVMVPVLFSSGEDFGVKGVFAGVWTLVVCFFGYGIMFVSFPVWYERLRLRHENNSAGPEPSMAPASDQSVSQAGVGPYAETTPGGTE